MKFRATIIPSGNATAVEVPAEVMVTLGPDARPPVAITINGASWRSRVALKNGQRLIGISAANREAAGIAEGDTIEISRGPRHRPRTVEEPDDLATALDASPTARAAFDKLAFGLKTKHIRDIEAAKSDRKSAPAASPSWLKPWAPSASARTTARYRTCAARHRSAARGCTAPNAASPPSRAAAHSSPRASAAAPTAPSHGTPSAR